MSETIPDRTKTIPNELAILKRDIDDFKSAQSSGGSSVILYTTQSNNTWDVLNASIQAGGSYSQWIVTFIPDIVAPVYVEFGLNYLYHDTATGFEQIFYWADPFIAGSSNGVQRYIVYTLNNLSNPEQLNLKFQFRSTSPGTFNFIRSAS